MDESRLLVLGKSIFLDMASMCIRAGLDLYTIHVFLPEFLFDSRLTLDVFSRYVVDHSSDIDLAIVKLMIAI